jgi:tetratricopeptide (TPR) repeat protein
MAEQDKAYDYHHRAFEAMANRRLTKREELRIRAVYAHDTHDYVGAYDYFRSFALTYPDDYVALTGYAFSMLNFGLEEEAIKLFVEAEALRPEAYQPLANSARAHLVLGRFDVVPDYIDRIRSMGLEGCADWVEGHMYFAAGELDRAIEAYRRAGHTSNPLWRHLGISYVASVLAELGRFREAVSVLERGVTSDLQMNRVNDAADKLLSLAYIQFQQGDLKSCKDTCLEALKLDRGSIRLLRAGTMLGQSGHILHAEEIYNSLPVRDDVPMFTIIRHRVLGEILMSQGNLYDALQELEKAYELEAPAHQNEYLARAFVQSGEMEEARKHYQEMSASFARLLWHNEFFSYPGLWANVTYEYGALSYEVGDVDEAKAALSRYLELRSEADPNSPSVLRAQQLLRSMSETGNY